MAGQSSDLPRGAPVGPLQHTAFNLVNVRQILPLAVLMSVASTLSAQGPSLPPFLELRIPKPPTVATADGTSFLVYEMHVTNFSMPATTIKRVEVTAGNESGPRHVLFSLADSALSRNLTRPGTNTAFDDRVTLAGGARAVVWLWVPIDRNAPPVSVITRVILEQGKGDSARTQMLDSPPAPVSREGAPIGAPLRGGVWLAGNGPAAESGHRRALIPIGGTPSIAQRFAIDWVKVAEDNRTFSGDSLKNSSYYAYGQDALAVGDGRVVETKDSIPENIPGINSRAVPITLETVGGNHVIIELGGGRYAFYAHLQPGSLRVKLGDQVRRGQVVGLVGNSGNSTEPHLHFHISDGNSPLGSEGLPYNYEAFDLVGRCVTFGSGCERSAPEARRRQMPLDNMLVRFPQ